MSGIFGLKSKKLRMLIGSLSASVLLASASVSASVINITAQDNFNNNQYLGAGKHNGSFNINSQLNKNISNYKVRKASFMFTFMDDNNDYSYSNNRWKIKEWRWGPWNKEHEIRYKHLKKKQNAFEKATVSIGNDALTGQTQYYNTGERKTGQNMTKRKNGCAFAILWWCKAVKWEITTNFYYEQELGYKGNFSLNAMVDQAGLFDLGQDGILNFAINVMGDLKLVNAKLNVELEEMAQPPVPVPVAPTSLLLLSGLCFFIRPLTRRLG
ncbi:hypothetical protein H0A36_19010 [Endozoicomonas sp. SM1973]|uniref:PEP-CTERM sorting domain-containing protein n=1 Tax=Spartinivicinus marinus TaxID=2994442 RepID=A0A853I2D4_9GAMM|nr:hypothetical protein [Spartinivicinus marinus]MCX4025925.1 hypothetical protein [Spartinivicinus marinus]NYZ68110.1 hypothetical protein [Spartinivicinus marinus]